MLQAASSSRRALSKIWVQYPALPGGKTWNNWFLDPNGLGHELNAESFNLANSGHSQRQKSWVLQSSGFEFRVPTMSKTPPSLAFQSWTPTRSCLHWIIIEWLGLEMTLGSSSSHKTCRWWHPHLTGVARRHQHQWWRLHKHPRFLPFPSRRLDWDDFFSAQKKNFFLWLHWLLETTTTIFSVINPWHLVTTDGCSHANHHNWMLWALKAYALSDEEDKSIPGCTRKSIISRPKEVILPLYSAVVRHLRWCIKYWAP